MSVYTWSSSILFQGKKADGKQSQKLEHKAFANTEHLPG